MRPRVSLAGFGAALLIATFSPALAIGPVDGEIGAVYWLSEYDSTGGSAVLDSEDAEAPGYRAELWVFKRYGVRAGIYSSDLDDLGMDTSDYMSIDLLWKAFAPTENNFFALGAGWEEMDLATIGLAGETSGVRVSAEGRVSAGIAYFYGQGAYLPSLDDAEASLVADGRFVDLTGVEYELGVSFKIFPFVSLRGGYRSHTVDFTRTDFDPAGTEVEGEVESGGFLLGLSARF